MKSKKKVNEESDDSIPWPPNRLLYTGGYRKGNKFRALFSDKWVPLDEVSK